MSKGVLYSIFFLFLFFAFAQSADAALLYVSPADGIFTQGDKVNIQIYVSSPVPINAVSGIINFSTKNFSVESISKSGSILSFWVEEPSFSNTKGTINFEGVSPGSGYEGSRGKVISVTLRALQPGKGEISFGSGSVLANDGSGTNVLQSFGNAEFTVKSPQPKPVVPTPDTTGATTTEAEVSVGPPEPPIIEKYKSEITPEEFFRAEGSTIYPDVEVIFQFESEAGEIIHQSTQAFSSGKFVFTLGQTLKSGVYRVSAVVKNSGGVKSEPSQTIIISVKPSAWLLWSNKIIQILSIIVPILSLFIIFIFFVRKQIKRAICKPEKEFFKDVLDTGGNAHQALDSLKNDVYELIKLLEQTRSIRTFTKEEDKIFEDMKKNISNAEESLIKKIKKVDGELG